MVIKKLVELIMGLYGNVIVPDILHTGCRDDSLRFSFTFRREQRSFYILIWPQIIVLFINVWNLPIHYAVYKIYQNACKVCHIKVRYQFFFSTMITQQTQHKSILLPHLVYTISLGTDNFIVIKMYYQKKCWTHYIIVIIYLVYLFIYKYMYYELYLRFIGVNCVNCVVMKIIETQEWCLANFVLPLKRFFLLMQHKNSSNTLFRLLIYWLYFKTKINFYFY